MSGGAPRTICVSTFLPDEKLVVDRGMASLLVVSGDACIAALRRFGYEIARQSGSHVRLVCVGRSPVTVPRHATLKRGTLRSILRVAEISVDAFVAALGS